MKKNSFIIIISVSLLAFGCQIEKVPKVKHGEDLVFTTGCEALSSGDLVGVACDDPIGYRNVRTTFSGGKLTPGNSLYWPVDMPDSAVTFTAYYPYTSEYNDGGTVIFTVQPDQSSDAAFRASDLMTSVTTASVNDPSVDFSFTHMMSKLVLYLRNDTANPVTEVSFATYPSVQFNTDNMSVKVYGEKVDVKAHLSGTSAEGIQAWELILPPQKTQLNFTVKTEAAEFTAYLSSKTKLEGGTQYSNVRAIALNADKTTPYTISVNTAGWALTPAFDCLDPVTDGAEIADLTDPGLYRIKDGIAYPIRTYETGSDQFSLISGSSLAGWRLQNLPAAQMFSLTASTDAFRDGGTYDISVRSFGLEDLTEDFSSTADVIKADGDLIWLTDRKKDFGYIIPAQ